MKTLELKHLSPYLTSNVMCFDTKRPTMLYILTPDIIVRREKKRTMHDLRLILRPLSDLTKEIEHNGEKFVPKYALDNIISYSIDYNNVIYTIEDILFVNYDNGYSEFNILESYTLIEKLFEWHFDVFGLITAGLAIDINTLTNTTI